ncbi:hypothetical protein GBAR_LOCUS15182 [Geodia barretti]|uniref:Uncharacterized protein n=1 Tax=Geodia barretti TaxID=519541 RepID=A0AA35SD42_GEOBA|nr:hypothetical protein GBAR_LOCUS15182 [Geodia barretti]
MRTLFCLLLGVLPYILRAQLDCPSLGFSDVVASSGAALSRCARADEQCCTQEYIDSVQAAVVAELQDGLVGEFADVIEEYQDDVENLIEYFKNPFLERLVESLPPAAADMFDPTNQELLETVNELSNNYIIPEDDDDDDDDDDKDDKKKRQAVVVFNPRQFVERLIGNAAVAAFNNSMEDCVRETALSLVNSNGNAISAVATRIQTIRQSLSTLNRIQAFLEVQRGAFVNNVDLKQCVSKFIDIAFCSRCTESTPPLCFNACNALLRACYSPYYTALNEQIAPTVGGC